MSDTLKHLESLLTAKYLRGHATEIRHIIQAYVLSFFNLLLYITFVTSRGINGCDWRATEEPVGVSAFILRALLVLSGAASDLAALTRALHFTSLSAMADGAPWCVCVVW